MDYQETLRFLYENLPMFQRTGKAAYKATLDNTLALDVQTHHPHRNFKSIHIAGTNGKGSVSHLLSSVMQEAGYKTGLYTSPHLVDFRERIRINGKMISEHQVIDCVEELKPAIETIQPSFFEITAAMAFLCFSREEIDIAVIETGMGGRLDSTNIITPLLSVITNISLDHTEFLGDTLEQIAKEKAGIIKNNVPVITGQIPKNVLSVIQKTAQKKSAPFINAESSKKSTFQTLAPDGNAQFHFQNLNDNSSEVFTCGLSGSYQSENIITVLSVIESLRNDGMKIQEDAVRNGLKNVVKNTSLRGRWEILGANPRIIADTAHNEAGISAVMTQLEQIAHKNLHIVWGMAGDKPAQKIFRLLPKSATYYLVLPSIPRAMPLNNLINIAQQHGLKHQSFVTVPEGYEAAVKNAEKEDTVFIGGSTFVVADLLLHLD